MMSLHLPTLLHNFPDSPLARPDTPANIQVGTGLIGRSEPIEEIASVLSWRTDAGSRQVEVREAAGGQSSPRS